MNTQTQSGGRIFAGDSNAFCIKDCHWNDQSGGLVFADDIKYNILQNAYTVETGYKVTGYKVNLDLR